MHSTNSATTIKAFMRIFVTHGIPKQMVSDNGSQFTSSDSFVKLSFYKANNIFSVTYHHRWLG